MRNLQGIFHDKQLQTIGTMLAGYSHEMKNHLAVIKESNGLMSDLLGMGGIQDPVLQSRLVKITESINKRIQLLAEMAKHLNGFAHRNDNPMGPFQLNDILNEEMAFLERFANLRSIGLDISFPQALPVVYGNPSLIQFVFANLFFLLLSTSKQGGTIAISSGQQDSSVHFMLQPEGEAKNDEPALAAIDHDQALQAALRVIGASLSMQSADGKIRTVVCEIPISYEFTV